ncbi:MAG: RHS repeat domain-containing protein, partial [Akkermansiaceae bacterium]
MPEPSSGLLALGGASLLVMRRRREKINIGGNLTILTCKNAETGDQVTRWIYGTETPASDIATTALLHAKVYPDNATATDPQSSGSPDRVEYQYNRAGELTQKTDQNGTVHEYDYDKLGALLHDRVIAFGSAI